MIADSGFIEHQAGRRIDTNSQNVQYVMKPMLYADGWELSPTNVRWDGRYWGGIGKYGDTIVFTSMVFGVREFTYRQKEYNTLPPVFCPGDSIRGMHFRGGGFGLQGRSGAIALRLTEPLKKDSFYRIPFVYIHESERISYGTRNSVEEFSLNIFTSDTSVVYRENYSASWLSLDTLHNYEFIETLPFAHNEKWEHHWLEFTATAAQDGNDWMILHVPNRWCTGILMNFADAREVIDVLSDQDTFVYCADTLVHLERDTLLVYDSTQRMRPDGLFWGNTIDTFFYTTPDVNGCRVRDYQHIEYIEKEAFAISTSSICDYDSISLVPDVEEFVSTSYLWSTGEVTDSITLQDTGLYWVQVNQGFCQFNDTFHLNYFDKPIFTLGADSFICSGDSIQIGTTTPDAVAYNWNTGETSSTIYIDTAFSAILTISNTNCYSSDTIELVKHLRPSIALKEDTTFCNTDSVWIDVAAAGINTFVWNDGTTASSRWINDAGLYSVSFEDQYCSNTDTIQAYIDVPIQFSLGNDTAFCDGGSLYVNLAHLAADEYTWHTGANTAEYTSSSTEQVQALVRNGTCFTRDTLEVTVHSYPILQLGIDTLICETDSIYVGTSEIADAYLWNDGQTDAQRWISASGEYKLTITSNNCSTSDSMILSTDAIQFLNLPNDTTFCKDERLFIDGYVENAASYNWSDGEITDSRWVEENGLYVLNVDTRSCGTLSDSIDVTVKQCQCHVWIPSAFTPNLIGSLKQNQLNNTFNPYIDCPLLKYSLQIYNRWGELLFESEDYVNNVWDGNYKGEPVPIGAYIWKLTYQVEGFVLKNEVGTVTVLR